MSYKAHTLVITALGVGLSLLEVVPASAAVLSWEQTASGRTPLRYLLHFRSSWVH